MESVTVVEIMGRDSGWLTAASALCKGDDCEGPDMIFLPERPFDIEYLKNRVAEIKKTKKSMVIAVSEGIRNADGEYICNVAGDGSKDIFGHVNLSGTARVLAAYLKKELGIKTRAVELSTLQRCASHLASATDVEEAFSAGAKAVYAAADGHSGEMVLLKRTGDMPYECVCDTYDVHKIANLAKIMPDSMINEAGDYVTDEFINYALPLIKGEVTQFITNGLPGHLLMTKI